MIWCIKTYIIAYVKTQKIRFIIHYVKPTAQLLFKIMAYHRIGDKPLSVPVLAYYSETYSEIAIKYFRQQNFKMSSSKWHPFHLGLCMLNYIILTWMYNLTSLLTLCIAPEFVPQSESVLGTPGGHVRAVTGCRPLTRKENAAGFIRHLS